MYIATFRQAQFCKVTICDDPYTKLKLYQEGTPETVTLMYVSRQILDKNLITKYENIITEEYLNWIDCSTSGTEAFNRAIAMRLNISYQRIYNLSTSLDSHAVDILMDEIQENMQDGTVFSCGTYYPMLFISMARLLNKGYGYSLETGESKFNWLMRWIHFNPDLADLDSSKILQYIPFNTTENYYRNVRQFYKRLVAGTHKTLHYSILKGILNLPNSEKLPNSVLAKHYKCKQKDIATVKKILSNLYLLKV